MDDNIKRALASGLTCDITTTGRASGQPRRIEIWYFVVGEQVYLTGTPGPRDWYANLQAQPRLVFHVKEGAQADLPARALLITDPTERRRIMGEVMRSNSWFRSQSYDLDAWVASSPLVEVQFE
jgi:deazaflavin-dependent oxidoreductase (nitroreductase family)